MVRRPLVRLSEKFDLVSRLVGAKTGLPPYIVHAADPRFTYPDSAAVARVLGLPQKPEKRQVLSVRQDGQHPTAFLQLGWVSDGKRQIAYEMGDAGMILSLHFRRAEPSHADCPWHLDVVEIDDGKRDRGHPVPCHIPCDDDMYAPYVTRALAIAKGVTTLMAMDDWRGAQGCFTDNLRDLVRELDIVSEMDAVDYEAGFRDQYGEVKATPTILRP